MSYDISYDADAGIISVTHHESFDLAAVDGFIEDTLSAVKKHQCYRIFIDYRGVELVGTITKIYNVPKKVSKALSEAGLQSHVIKRALVISGYTKGFRFLEAVSINRGQPLKIFQDIDEAKKWLTEGK